MSVNLKKRVELLERKIDRGSREVDQSNMAMENVMGAIVQKIDPSKDIRTMNTRVQVPPLPPATQGTVCAREVWTSRCRAQECSRRV